MTTTYPLLARDRPQPTDRMPSGAVLRGRFVVVRLITTTALSHVYLGHNLQTGQPVAIKQSLVHMAQGGLESAMVLRLFQGEAMLLRRLQHAQIPHLLAAFRDRSSAFLVMEYIAGITLEQRLGQGSLPHAEALLIAHKLCYVVEYLHQHVPPIIHSDIKPGNILLREDGRVVLLDYGLARPRGIQGLTNQAVGTPGYAPPEQWRGEPLDQRSDVYALGMVLQDLFGASARSTIQQVLVRATALETSERFTSVSQLRRALCQADKPARAEVRAMPKIDDQGRAATGGHRGTALQGWWLALFRMCMALLFVGVVFLRLAHEPGTVSTIATSPSPALPMHVLSPPTPDKPIDRSAIALAQRTLDRYQQGRSEAIARQAIGLIEPVADDLLLEYIHRIIDLQRDLGAHMLIIPISLETVNARQFGDAQVEIVVDKTEDRLFYPAGCRVPDDQPPCRAAQPVTVRAERYQVRYSLTYTDSWKVTSWEVLP
jgi:serine/threonine protein kinase